MTIIKGQLVTLLMLSSCLSSMYGHMCEYMGRCEYIYVCMYVRMYEYTNSCELTIGMYMCMCLYVCVHINTETYLRENRNFSDYIKYKSINFK